MAETRALTEAGVRELGELIERFRVYGLPWMVETCTGGYCAMVGYCASGETPFPSPLSALRAAHRLAIQVPPDKEEQAGA